MNDFTNLAKSTVETYIKEGKIISPPEYLPQEFFKKRAGVFVTIEKDGDLRGCIGTYIPTKINIAEEIIHNAVSSAVEDYRFGQIKPEELQFLSYTVYILNTPEPVKDIKELDPQKFGIIVKTGPLIFSNDPESLAQAEKFDGKITYKTGLLLPDLEGVKTTEQQLSIACLKGDINPQEEKIFIYKFTVEKHE